MGGDEAMTTHKDRKPTQVKEWRPKPNPTQLQKSRTTRETIIKLVAAGNYRSAAYSAAGVSKWCYYHWIKQGTVALEKRDEGESLDPTEEELAWFVEEIEKADSAAEAALVARWYTEAVDGDWRAAERFLAKKVPERWSDPATRLEISGPAGGPVQQLSATINVTAEIDAERQRKVLEALVDAGDMPKEVLEAWDSTDDDSGITVEFDEMEAAVQPAVAALAPPEAAGVPDVDDN